VNDCSYCEAAYTGATKVAGFDEETTVAIRRGEVPGDDRLTRRLQLAREIAANRGDVDDGTWKDALEAGWSEKERLEDYAEVVRTIFTNYFNRLVGTEVDRPAPPALTERPCRADRSREERR
jgi:alkylhydroperoxidase family enzyme